MAARRRTAFTIVELLVVVGLVAFLAGMLLPSLNRAGRSARATACANNLRQVGHRLLMYVNNHRGRLPWIVEPLWRTDGTLNLNADASADPQSLRSVLAPYLSDPRVYLCPSPNLAYPVADPQVAYRFSSANNYDGQPRTPEQLMTCSGPRYEHSLKYLNGRVYRLEYVESAAYPFRLVHGVRPFYLARDFVAQSPTGEFLPPHPLRRFNQLRLD